MYDPSQRRVQCVSKLKRFVARRRVVGLLSFCRTAALLVKYFARSWRAATAGIDGAALRGELELAHAGRAVPQSRTTTDRSVTYAVVVSGHGGGRGGHADARGIHVEGAQPRWPVRRRSATARPTIRRGRRGSCGATAWQRRMRILGAANQAGEDNRNVARMAALLAGLPDETLLTVNRLCASAYPVVSPKDPFRRMSW